MYAEKTEVRANRIDARVVDKKKKKVLLLEMSCPWMANRKQKEEEKTSKYAPLRWEIRHVTFYCHNNNSNNNNLCHL